MLEGFTLRTIAWISSCSTHVPRFGSHVLGQKAQQKETAPSTEHGGFGGDDARPLLKPQVYTNLSQNGYGNGDYM